MSVSSSTVERRGDQPVDGGSNPADTLHFYSGDRDAAEWLILNYHYSKRVAANVQEIFTAHAPGGLFGDRGPVQAACIFSLPPTKWREPVVELIRLVRRERRIVLSRFVSWSIRQMKAKGYDLLVSFADATHGHHGGIYQATNWKYHGFRKPSKTALLVNGTRVPCRSCNSAWGTNSVSKLRRLKPHWTIEPIIDDGKYLYWFPLNRDGQRKAERLGLKSSAYPKPEAE